MSDIDYRLLRQLIDSGSVDEALKVVKNIEDPDKRSFAIHFIVTVLSQRSRFREALKIARDLRGDFTYVMSLFEIIRHLSLFDRLSEALDVAMLVPEEYSKFRVMELTYIASRLLRNGRVDEAVMSVNEAIKSLKNLSRDEIEELKERRAPKEESDLDVLIKTVNSLLRVDIELPRRVIREGEDLEVVIRSNIEVENALVEFEGLDLSPVILEKLRDVTLKIKPPFEPGRKRLLIYVSFNIIETSYIFVREFELEFVK